MTLSGSQVGIGRSAISATRSRAKISSSRHEGKLLVPRRAFAEYRDPVTEIKPQSSAALIGAAARQGWRLPTTTSASWIYRPEVRLQIRAAGSEHEFRWGEVLYVPSLKSSQLVLRNPIWRGDRFAGVVLGAVSLGQLSTMLANSTVRNLGKAFILRGRDQVVADAALRDGPQNVSQARALP